MKTRTIIGIGLIVGLSSAVLWGCGESGSAPRPEAEPLPVAKEVGQVPLASAPADEGEPVEGDYVVIRLRAEPAHLNPITGTDGYAMDIFDNVFESMTDRDYTTFELRPQIAESWEISDDHLTYTFHLRKDVKFSDGTPVTAHDAKFSFDIIKDPAVDAAALRNYYNDVLSCEAVDDYTVVFKCSQPYFKHIDFLSLAILPKHVYGTGDFNNHPNNRAPIGSGPYVFERWDTGSQVVLTRNENYWGEKPKLKKIIYKFITDDNAALQVLERQDVDVMLPTMTPEQWVSCAGRPDFQAKFNLIKGFAPRYSYIVWNQRRPQFEDKRVRRAMTLLLDRPLILDTIFRGLPRQATGIFYDEIENNPNLKPLPFDPKEAKRLLDEAGWIDTDNDGIRDKNGIPFTFEMQISSGIREYEQMATVYQEELKRAGIQMSIRPLEWATFTDRLHTRNFDAAPLSWASTTVINNDPYQIWHSSQIEKGSNYGRFVNEEADKIIEAGRLEFDRDKRIKRYYRLQEIIHEEQPYTLLFNGVNLVAVDKRFRNVRLYKRGVVPREWWVPLELQKYH
ncbi:MAG TPA: peptide-binding protein [Candidatus Bathyarchaeia archaeon]|nr:peptide-binding protein [Candidatus Bathyarchaeia archaeon]